MKVIEDFSWKKVIEIFDSTNKSEINELINLIKIFQPTTKAFKVTLSELIPMCSGNTCLYCSALEKCPFEGIKKKRLEVKEK